MPAFDVAQRALKLLLGAADAYATKWNTRQVAHRHLAFHRHQPLAVRDLSPSLLGNPLALA
ncbi:hypothetical protein [Candidatus Erwinia dacicola]|uniref:Uncharacterized protein n=1 Tax=Candidatus Erwinia dacicola TaxID=252393 RepID=A0A1E7Z533_9GAMM|nr:hypothetical protein [Candidatus Erwinia dacicola]OFC63821.1 hypothetical protein BBW68_03805 [Candidatus Erwinia dacicola]